MEQIKISWCISSLGCKQIFPFPFFSTNPNLDQLDKFVSVVDPFGLQPVARLLGKQRPLGRVVCVGFGKEEQCQDRANNARGVGVRFERVYSCHDLVLAAEVIEGPVHDKIVDHRLEGGAAFPVAGSLLLGDEVLEERSRLLLDLDCLRYGLRLSAGKLLLHDVHHFLQHFIAEIGKRRDELRLLLEVVVVEHAVLLQLEHAVIEVVFLQLVNESCHHDRDVATEAEGIIVLAAAGRDLGCRCLSHVLVFVF